MRGLRRLLAEVVGVALDRGGGPRGVGGVVERPRLVAVDEAEHDPGRPAGRGGVEGGADGLVGARDLAVESLGAPERRVVDGDRLDQRADRHPLGELVARGRQLRLVDDAPGQVGRDRHHHPLRLHRRLVGVDVHALGPLRDPAHRLVEQHALAPQPVGGGDRRSPGCRPATRKSCAPPWPALLTSASTDPAEAT